jgi:hypothetical protein
MRVVHKWPRSIGPYTSQNNFLITLPCDLVAWWSRTQFDRYKKLAAMQGYNKGFFKNFFEEHKGFSVLSRAQITSRWRSVTCLGCLAVEKEYRRCR